MQYCSSRVTSLLGEISVLITLLATLQKWFKSSGKIPLVVLIFAGGCLLVSRLIARYVPFEFLPFAKMSAKIFFESRAMYMTLFLRFCIHQIVLV